MSSTFGASETLIFSGTALLITGNTSVGWVLLGLGVTSGFLRYVSYWGQKAVDEEDKKDSEIERLVNALSKSKSG